MDGRSVLLAATICLSLWDKKKISRIQDIHNNGKKTDDVHNESINGFNLAFWHTTCSALRGIRSALVKSKIYLGLFHVRFSYVLCEDTKEFRK